MASSTDRPIGIMVRMFANDPRNRGSILDWVIPKTQKLVLDATKLNIQHYKVRIKSKWSNPKKGVALSPTPWYSSYWKTSLWVALDYGQPTYLYSFKYSDILMIIFKKSTWPIVETPTGINTMKQNEPGSNGNEWVTPYPTGLLNWSLATWCNLVSYLGHPFLGQLYSLQKICSQCIIDPTNQVADGHNG